MDENQLEAKSEPASWWARPCGGREVLQIALPMVISTGFWSLMLFIDRMFLLWHSPDEMAAALPAGMLYWSMTCFFLGVAMYVNTFVAQYFGAGKPERIGLAVWQGLRLGIYATPLFLVFVPLAPYIFALAGHSPEMQAHEVIYFQVLAFGAGAEVIAAAMASFFTGRGVTRVVMWVNLWATLLNIALDYVWIFGLAGFPEMGIAGAALATVVSHWFKVAVFWVLLHERSTREHYHILEGRRFDGPLLWRLIRFGAPNGLQFFIEASAFSLVIMFIGRFGQTAMAATTLAFNVNAVAFIPMFGLGIAVSTLVGQEILRGRPHLAVRATWTSIWLAMIYTGVSAVFYVLLPDLILFGYAAGMDPAEFTQIRNTAVVLLRFVAAYCLFDAAQIVFVGVIRGAGDTRFVLISTVVIASIAIVVGVTVEALAGWGLYWWWTVITGWVLTLGIVYWARFQQGSWKTMRVIEPDVVAENVVAETNQPFVELSSSQVADPLIAVAPEQSSG